METNLELGKDKALREAAERLLDAAMGYWKAYREATGGAAVVWVTDTDGRMVILTRGEYRATLMQNIDILKRHEERVYNYDGTAEKLPTAPPATTAR